MNLATIRIRVGEYDFNSNSEPYPYVEGTAKRKVVHPKYNLYTYENDLALVQLDQPLRFAPHVAPICLPPDEIELLGRNATVTGWGRLNEGGILPTVLQEVRVPIVSNDKCKNMFSTAGRPEYIPDIFLCAGYEEGGRDSCQVSLISLFFSLLIELIIKFVKFNTVAKILKQFRVTQEARCRCEATTANGF